MSTSVAPAARTSPLVKGIVAGLIGGILIDLFLIVARLAPFPGIWQFVASGLVGKVAFTSSSYIAVGLVMHFVISIVWATLYAYAAAGRNWNWLLSGAVFGIIVMIAMQIVQTVSHLASGVPAAGMLFGGLIAHVVFFGWPVAWYVARD